MKIEFCEAVNFASYSSVAETMSGAGLVLVYGPTGVGKSTLADLPAWVLFGVTAKNGSVDDVRNWNNSACPTKGSVIVTIPTGTITVYRTRGRSHENDLYWIESHSDSAFRGKDITETQKLLETRLGVSADLYLTAAYFHEFSPTGAFFTAKARDRRAVLESIASLELAAKIAERTSDDRKFTKKAYSEAEATLERLRGRHEQLEASKKAAQQGRLDFSRRSKKALQELEQRAASFDKEKSAKIEKLEDRRPSDIRSEDSKLSESLNEKWEELAAVRDRKCPTCGGADDSELQIELTAEIQRLQKSIHYRDGLVKALSQWRKDYATAVAWENPYLERVAEEKGRVNPFNKQLLKAEQELKSLNEAIVLNETIMSQLSRKLSHLGQLYDLSSELRGALLRRTVSSIEAATNGYLERFFDAELRVTFSLRADVLEISIQKSGYECVYAQLSKGQRQLLKLCFAVSIMNAAANKAGIHFDNLFIDEGLDGMDTALKLKAFKLFEELSLSHGSVLVIDHCEELKSLFPKMYEVNMIEDSSVIKEVT